MRVVSSVLTAYPERLVERNSRDPGVQRDMVTPQGPTPRGVIRIVNNPSLTFWESPLTEGMLSGFLRGAAVKADNGRAK